MLPRAQITTAAAAAAAATTTMTTAAAATTTTTTTTAAAAAATTTTTTLPVQKRFLPLQTDGQNEFPHLVCPIIYLTLGNMF
jgi:hypothetical protein